MENNTHPSYFDQLSSLTELTSTTPLNSVAVILQLGAGHLNMGASFLTHITPSQNQLEIVDVYTVPGGPDVRAGMVIPLSNTFCSIIASATKPSFLFIGNTHTDPEYSTHLAASSFPSMGSYAGVPVLLSEGSLFGTLVVSDPQPQTFTIEQAKALAALARVLATLIERESELAEDADIEAALRRSEKRFRTIFTRAAIGIALVDREGRIAESNPALQEMLGYSGVELGQMRFTQFNHPDEAGQAWEHYKALITSTGNANPLERRKGIRDYSQQERRFCRKDGSTLRVNVNVSLIRDEQGNPEFAIGMIENVTERLRAESVLVEALAKQKAANDELERVNQARSQFVSIVSHEFRTPLTVIHGFSEMLRDEEFRTEEVKEYAADINRETLRLNRLINELLDLDRMESGKMKLHLAATDLNEVIITVANLNRSTAPKHLITLELDTSIPTPACDSDKLTQMFTNLINNAIKYSPHGGEIHITSRSEGASVHVSIADQGIGMPSNALEKIFERFSRIESDQSRYIQGTGLGLPITRQIIILHGGKIWAESTLGQGSIFHFTLPIANVPEKVLGGENENRLLRG